jgi:hypothetical protein
MVASHIPLHVIIPVYRNPYVGAHIAQTNGGRTLADSLARN